MISRLFRFVFFLHCTLVIFTGDLHAQNTSIWITGPLEKVLQTNTTPGGAQSLQISASRNEFADFQVHAIPSTNPIQMNVTVSDFTNSQANYTIKSAKNVFLYREAYLNVTTLSDQNGTPGVTPDPLIPTVDPYAGQARNAFPVTVAANQTQSAWIDVLVPVGAPPGNYTGTVTISDGSNAIGQLSVALNVWAFTLPSTASLKSAFGISWNGMCVAAYGAGSDNGYSECAQYPGSGGNVNTAFDLIYRSEIMLALDHRISLSGGVYAGPPPGDWTQFDATYSDLLNGTAPTVLSGAALTTISYAPATNLTAPSTIQDWVAHFTGNSWLGALFDNTCDFCSFSDALSAEQTIYAASPNLKTMLKFNIADATANNLLPDLNIIVPPVEQMEPQGGSNQRSTYNSFLSGTNTHLWWYQWCRTYGSCTNGSVGPATSTYPSYTIDASPVRNRVFQWLAYLDSIEAEFYEQVDYCWVDLDGSCGSNPWAGVYHNGGNGDQTLIYPGTPAEIGGTTPVPVPSIRLKLIRDGMQDYEYLHALSQAGQGAFVASTVQSFITNAYTFSNDPQALLSARQALGNQLSGLVPATTLTSSLNPSNYGQSVTFTATVTATSGTTTGTVTFYSNVGGTLGTVALSSGIATFTTKTLAAANHTITAVYSGDSNFATSTSAPLSQTVNTGVTLQVSPATSLNAAGGEGGPFGPAAFHIQLSGDIGSVDYSISGVPSWLTASSTSGTVTTSPTTVTFTVNASANRLTAGNYTATITITNTDSGQGTLALSAGLGVNQTNQGGGGGGGGGGGAQNAGIWITGPMVKVLQTNAAFGTGQSLQISASRNEFADFQVHAVPTAIPIQMNVTVSDFVNTQAGYTIPSATNVILYREAYLNITTLSDANGTYGLTPDPLIPTLDPYSRQATNAFPVTAQPNQTQSAWIDVQVPVAAPPGNYTGVVTISDGSNVIGQLSVSLKVWAFTLPSTVSMKSEFAVSDGAGMCIQAYGYNPQTDPQGYFACAANYPGAGGNGDTAGLLIHRNEAKLMLDHRVSLGQGVIGGPGANPASGAWAQMVANYGDLLNGTASTLLPGAALTTAQYTPPSPDHYNSSVIQDWVTNFTANGWLGALFDYTCDLPGPGGGCSFADALTREQTIHAGSPNMKTLITVDLADATANNLLPDLNIIVPGIGQVEVANGPNLRSSYDSFLSGTNKYLWWTNACSNPLCAFSGIPPTYPTYYIDAAPVRNRVLQWLQFIDNIEGELYYMTDWCWYANQTGNTGFSSCGSNDPWVNVYSFGGNGDGTLYYPGTPAKIGVTTPVPVPSIRLKLLRDGMQDYEYLHALSQAGHDTFARQTAATFITNLYAFNTDPQALLAAREALGNQLSQLVPSTTLTSSLNASNFGQSVTFTATVTANAGTPTGTVTFYDNAATALGTGTLSSGTAAFTTTSLSVGSHSITAVYSGDGNFATSTSSPLTQIVNQTFTLLVSETGNGTVTSSPSAINCGSTCSASFAGGAQVALTATAGSGSYFSGWGGACSGTASCVVTMSSAQSVSATFVSGASSTLSVFISGNGTATSTPSGISCTPTCSASFAIGQQVTLNASPAIGWTFSGWTGACSGTGGCSVTMNAAPNVAATFTSTGGTQSSRTWVSASTGSDSNPCSRTAPCLTFAGALASTAAGGEIDVLDPGDFGPVTITKAITIDGGDGQVASIILVGTHGINVLAGSTDVVILRNLRFNGFLNGGSPGTLGVVINSAGKTVVEKCDIFGFSGGGIDVIPTNGTMTVEIQETNISNNGAGIIIKPSGGAVLNGSIEHTHVYENGGGGVKVDGTAGGSSYVAITDSSISLNASNGMNAMSGAGGNVAVDIERVVFANNGLAGIQAGVSSGGTSMVTVGDSILSYNGSAWSIVNGATLLSFKHNQVTGPTGTPPNRGFFQ